MNSTGAPGGGGPNRILFVDDEQAVLSGIRDLLRKERRRWEMVFAGGAEQALFELSTQPFDLIISDMRMPGMDGAELLRLVKERHPSVARIVLSGYADREAVIRAMSVAQQFLSKPCDGALLKSVIERTFDLRQLLESELVRAVVGRVERLPAVPTVFEKLRVASENPAISISEIARLVESEPALSAKLLQLVNSCSFGTGCEITSIGKAVAHLGLDLFKGVVLASASLAQEAGWVRNGVSLQQRQRHAWMAAQLAKKFLPENEGAEEAFTAALLHGIGGMILAQANPEEYCSVVHDAWDQRRTVGEIERERFGTTHAEVGAYLLGIWGLPHVIVECVAHHLEPSRVKSGARAVLAAGHVAVALVSERFRTVPPGVEQIDRGFLEGAGLLDQLADWREIADQVLGRNDRAA